MRRPPASELLAWTLVGAAIGVVAGFALGEVLGPSGRRGARDLFRGTSPKPGPRSAELVRAVRAALLLDPQLRELELEPLPAGPGVVELHGWVPNRATRARAVRAVSGVTGVDRLVNCLLVRGEDDTGTPFDAATDQPA